MLEELGVPYNLRPISLSKNEQKEDWYLKVNPNGRIPALGKLQRVRGHPWCLGSEIAQESLVFRS